MKSEHILEKRSTGFWIITVVYIIAGILGVLTYQALH